MNKFGRKIPFFPVFSLFKMAFQNGGISFGKTPLFIGYVIRYLLLEPFRIAELLIYNRRLKNHVLTADPIFILGHWRSGTSHLQNLIVQDPRNTTTSIYQFLFFDNYFLSEKWLKKPLNSFCRIFKIPYSFQKTLMNLDLPGELESAMCSMCSSSSYTWGHIFPSQFEKWSNQFIALNDTRNAESWIEDYDYLIRKLSYGSKGKQVIVKSPGDTARVEVLLKKYPSAKFIYIHRDPIDVFHSSKYLWNVIQQQNSFQRISDDEIDHIVIKTYKLVIDTYLKSRSSIPEGQLVEISFTQIQQAPLETMKTIYKLLSLGDFPENKLQPFIKKNESFKISHYKISPELLSKLNQEWGSCTFELLEK